MQTAKFSLTLHPANVTYLRGVTPAELLILQQLHWKESQGTPIGDDLQLESGEAQTIEVEEKAAQSEYFHAGSGKIVPAKDFVPAVTHKRTQHEEAARLARKYTAKAPHIKDGKPIFVELFGNGPIYRLPETFEEILPGIGKQSILAADKVIETSIEADDLSKKTRAELVAEAIKLKLTVKQNATPDQLIVAILAAKDALKKEPVPA